MGQEGQAAAQALEDAAKGAAGLLHRLSKPIPRWQPRKAEDTSSSAQPIAAAAAALREKRPRSRALRPGDAGAAALPSRLFAASRCSVSRRVLRERAIINPEQHLRREGCKAEGKRKSMKIKLNRVINYPWI